MSEEKITIVQVGDMAIRDALLSYSMQPLQLKPADRIAQLERKRARLKAELRAVREELADLKNPDRVTWGMKRRRRTFKELTALRMYAQGKPLEEIASRLGQSTKVGAQKYIRGGARHWARRHRETTWWARYEAKHSKAKPDRKTFIKVKPATKLERLEFEPDDVMLKLNRRRAECLATTQH